VLGATLPLGVLLTRRLVSEGKAVRALVLNAERARSLLPESVSVTEIDMTRASIQDACGGASVIYDLYEPHSLKQQNVAVETASAVLVGGIQNRARVVIASHVFLTEDDNKALESEAMSTHRSKMTKVVVARLPQVYGPEVKNALLDNVFDEVSNGSKAHWMGSLDSSRSLLFIEDAVSAIQLLEKTEAAFGNVWNVAGPSPISGREFIAMAFRAAGKEGGAGVWGRGIMLTARFLDAKARAFVDLPYDYYSPFVLDGSAFAQAFPLFAYTPQDVAVRRSLEWHREQAKQKLVAAPLSEPARRSPTSIRSRLTRQSG
jgi:hypothetical protein